MSSISGRLGRLLAGASTIVAVAATLTLAPSATAGVVADGPDYQAPAAGECRNYTLTAADKPSNTTPVTPCSSTHTAKVFVVGHLPESVTWGQTDAVGKAVSDTCSPAFDQALGGTEKLRRMSAYTFFWFEPTPTQQSHGARWFRCDVAMWGHQALTPIPNVGFPVLGSGLKYGVTRCLYGSDTVHYTACKLSHSYRATGAFSISGTTYPGDTAIRNTAVRRCPNFVSTRAYYWVGPTRTSWKYGDRIFVCYSKLAH